MVDALSRAPSQQQIAEDDKWTKEVDYVCRSYIQQIQASQDKDSTCILLKKYCLEGWPSKQDLKGEIRKYIPAANELSLCEGLLLCNSGIVVPQTLQSEILQNFIVDIS